MEKIIITQIIVLIRCAIEFGFFFTLIFTTNDNMHLFDAAALENRRTSLAPSPIDLNFRITIMHTRTYTHTRTHTQTSADYRGTRCWNTF